ncbi:MAG TPA: hypothetical protein VMZ50_13600 [Phycisphaerae bacterium]|nr:hypothetical protein [Phycisphaerae bacterium]
MDANERGSMECGGNDAALALRCPGCGARLAQHTATNEPPMYLCGTAAGGPRTLDCLEAENAVLLRLAARRLPPGIVYADPPVPPPLNGGHG